ncbi:MAG: dipeptide epimerase [Cytophagales bacterium]|nr:MAG: dipeptide epimerase [Cytophagales bacterium]
MNWSIEEKEFELKYNWKLSRNETTKKTNLFVSCFDGKYTGAGEIAPNIRYNESPEKIKTEFQELLSDGLTNINEPSIYNTFINKKNISKSLKYGIETALLSYYFKKINTSFSEYYKINKVENCSICYTIPIINPNEIKSFISDYKLNRFKQLKLKINTENSIDIIKEVSKYSTLPLLIDANEAWHDVESLIIFLEKLKKYNISLIEQPMPDGFREEYIYLKKYSFYPIFADESIINQTDLEEISKQFDGINIKLMKTGGVSKALEILKEAEKFKLQTMIGCMVESTLGIYNAFNLSNLVNYVDLDGFMLLKNEPFQLLKEQNGIMCIN